MGSPTASQQTFAIKKHPRWGRRILGAFAALVFLVMLTSIVRNENFYWPIVLEFLFDPSIIRGIWMTIFLTLASMAIGIVLGTLLAVMRISDSVVLNTLSSGYIWIFRGTPLLVQLIFWYNLAALYPEISITIPFGPTLFAADTNSVVTVYVAALLGLGLNEAAYMAEIVRAGIGGVDSAQTRAAQSLGMTGPRIMRSIVLPQAMRLIIPPTGNQVIGMLKGSALVSVIAMPDLLYSAQLIYSSNFRPVPLLVVACIWYLLMTSVLSAIQSYIEKYYARGQ